ncbi:MAG: hypothetical protein N3A38_15715, partial [Planctomycetota bacterium]|nr:hypothetical protein [Planctomycetota bacterium]
PLNDGRSGTARTAGGGAGEVTSGRSAGTDAAAAQKDAGAAAARKSEREEKAARVLEECLAEIAGDPKDHAGNMAAMEAIRDAVKGTPSEAKLNAAIAAEKGAMRREAWERWTGARRMAEELAEARKFVSAIQAIDGFRRGEAEEKLAKAAEEVCKEFERRAAAAVRAAVRSATVAAGKGDVEAAKRVLGEFPEGEVPETCAAELRAAAETVAAAEARARTEAEKSGARAREALYGRYAASILGAAIARSGGDIEKALAAAKEAAGREEFGPVADRISEDVRELEECLRIEAAALDKWAASSKGQVVDLPKPMPGMTKGRIQEAKDRRVYIMGGTSGPGPTFCFTACQLPAQTIVELAGLDTSSVEGAVRAAAYLAARGETVAAAKALAPFRESGDPAVARLLSRLGAAEAFSRDAAAEAALARVEELFGTSKDEKLLAAALKEYEEKYGAADFSRRGDTAKRLAALRARLDALDPFRRMTAGRLRRMADGWYELVYTFDDAVQAAEFEIDRAMPNEPEARVSVSGGRLILRTAPHDREGGERRRGNISVQWKPRIPIESIRRVEYDVTPVEGGKWIGWYAPSPGARPPVGRLR